VNRLLGLRAGEGRPVGLAVSASFFSAAGLMIGQSGIEALFFARYGVGKLPVMYLLLGGTMFVASIGVAALLGTVGRARACLLIPLAIAMIALAGRTGLAADVSWIYPALWLLQGASYFLMGLAVWGLAGIVTDTRQAKRFFPLIGGGGVLGQVIGGLVTTPLASWIGADNLILVWVGTLVAVLLFGRMLIGSGTARERGRPRVDAIEQLREGFRYVRRSSLMRWLALGSIVFSLLFFSLYLPFGRAATARYPSPDDLAGFFGLFFGLSSGVAFLLSLFVSNRLLARFGVPTVMLVLPVVYVVAFGFLTIEASFAALAVFRFVQVAWMQGGAVSAWEAVNNTVPPDRRDQTRAFLYGGPTQVGTVLAGVIALVGERALSPSVLFGVGFACAVLATVAMLGVRRAYPRELVLALREGRPHVFGAAPGGADPFGLARGDSSAVAVAVAALEDPDPHVRRVSAHILRDLDAPDARSALIHALDDEDADVRATAIGSLMGDATALPRILDLLVDPDPGVRLAALDAVGSLQTEEVTRSVRPLLHDPDPIPRARAAGLLFASGRDAGAERTLLELAEDDDPEVRAAAFRAVQAIERPYVFDFALLGLRDPSAAVRAEALRALATIESGRAVDLLVESLADDDVAVRAAVAEGLGSIGAAAVDPVVGALFSPDRQLGALAALERLPLDGRGADVRRFAMQAVRNALESYRQASAIQPGGDERRELLKDSLLARADREAVIGLRAAALLGDRSAMSAALENISVTDPAQRANALEVIESVGDRDVVRPLLSMWEAAPSKTSRDDPLEQLRQDTDDWIRACADLVASDRGGTMTQTLTTLPLMERVLFLRRVPLFAELPPPDLQPIALIAEEHSYADDETIAEQGDPGDAMHIIVSGEVSIVVKADGGERTIAVRSTGDVIGEMAVITSQPRMAGLVAKGPVRVLSIGRRQFESILRERPETSLGVMRVLCQRLAEPVGSRV
jgi:HEAT repeat protein